MQSIIAQLRAQLSEALAANKALVGQLERSKMDQAKKDEALAAMKAGVSWQSHIDRLP